MAVLKSLRKKLDIALGLFEANPPDSWGCSYWVDPDDLHSDSNSMQRLSLPKFKQVDSFDNRGSRSWTSQTLIRISGLELLGSGNFSTVHLGWLEHDAISTQYVAVKKPKVLSPNEILEEIMITNSVGHHRNVMKAFGLLRSGNPYMFATALILEYVEGSFSPMEWLERQEDSTQRLKDTCFILSDVASGLKHLHSALVPVVHRDMWSDNVLLTVNIDTDELCCAKVSDFGTARLTDITSPSGFPAAKIDMCHVEGLQMKRQPTESHGLPPYYSVQSDVFQFGLLIWEISHLSTPYKHPTDLYADLPDERLLDALTRCGLRRESHHPIPQPPVDDCFEQHPIAARDLNDLHVTCLSANEQQRPRIEEVCESIQRLQSKLLNMDATRQHRGADGEGSA